MDAVNELSLLDQLKMQHIAYSQQRDQAQVNLNQLIGAVYACEQLINAQIKKESQENSGDKSNGEVKSESAECTAEE
jgi:hypothetical protein